MYAVWGGEQPARWQSSQRPLFVRTVWVNGLRHAVLSADDPLFRCRGPVVSSSGRRSGSCSSVSTVTSSSSGSAHSCDLEHCLIKLQLVISSDKSQTKANTPTSSRHRRSSCRFRQDFGPCCEGHQDSEESISGGAASVVGDHRRPYVPYVIPSSSEEERDQDPVEDHTWLASDIESYLPSLQLNPLSKRVLQWLDLVGRSVGVVDCGGPAATVSRCGKKEGKERLTSRYVATPASRPTSEVPANRRYSSQHCRIASMPTATLQTNLEASPVDSRLQQDPLRVTAAELKRVRVFQDLPATTDVAARRASPVNEECSFQSSDPRADSTTPSPPPPVKSGASRPQLHIFMPSLLRDRPILRHQDTADSVSDCSDA
jgi:hypothetical protein